MDADLLHPSENMLSSDDVSMKSSVHKTDVTLSTVRADIPGLLHVPDLAASCDDNVYLDPESNHSNGDPSTVLLLCDLWLFCGFTAV